MSQKQQKTLAPLSSRYNLKSRVNQSFDQPKSKQSSSTRDKISLTFLPLPKINRILKKIGARDKKLQMYIPNQQEQTLFRKSKIEELNKVYSPRKNNPNKPDFENQLDQIVIDCWKYDQKFGRETVWRKYRQNNDELSFRTLKVMKKKA